MKLKTKLSKLRHDGHITDAEYAIIINVLNKFSTQPPKTQQKVEQPCEDVISRAEAIRVAEQGQIQGYEWQFKKLCNLQSVTPHPNIGKWMRSWCEWQQYLECSKCGYETGLRCDTNYCPNCGAKMEVEE